MKKTRTRGMLRTSSFLSWGCTRPEVWNVDAWEVGRIWAGAAVLD